MARKVTPKKASRPEEGRDDLAVLHPHGELTLAGRTIVVREYGFIEGLSLRAALAPFVADLGVLISGGECLVEDVLDVLGQNLDAVRQAIAISIGPIGADAEVVADNVAWLASLGDAEGDALIKTWWGVCGFFFVRQIMSRSAERAKRKAFAGVTSTPTSSPPATAPPSSSAATPAASSASSTTA